MKRKLINLQTKLNSFANKSKWHNLIAQIILSDLFWLLIVCVIFRLICYVILFYDSEFPDSASYINYSGNLLSGKVDMLRTPVYPYFIKIVKLLGNEHLIRNIIFIQSIISFLTIILFYKILRDKFKNKWVILLASLVYGILPSIVNFDKCILTESISISAFVIFIYFLARYLKNPTITKAVLLTFYIFLLIMLRPSFIFLLPLIVLFWVSKIIFFKSDRRICLSGLASSIICILLIMGYSHLNYINNGCNSISVVSNINQLTIIRDYHIPMDQNDPELSETLNSIIYTEMQDSGLHIFSHYSQLSAQYSQTRIDKYIRNCLLQHKEIYIKSVLIKAYNLSNSKTSPIYAKTKGVLGKIFHYISVAISPNFYFILVLLFIDFVYLITIWIKSKKILWFKFILWSIIIGQIVISIIGAPYEFHRLFVIVYPAIIISFFTYIDLLFFIVDKNKLSNYPKLALI